MKKHFPNARFTITVTALTFLLTHSFTSGQEIAQYKSAVLTVVNDSIIASEAPGIVKQINAQPGQDLDQDATIIKLDHQEYEANLRVSLMNAKIAEIEAGNDVNLRYAQKTLEVNDKLLARSERARNSYAKAVTQTDIDRLKLEVDQSELSAEQAELQAEVATARMQLEKLNADVAKIRLDNRSIKAPFAGRLEQLFIQPGQWVNAGQEIARIVDLTRLRAKGIFDANLIQQIKVGNKATFTYKIGETINELRATVTFVSSVVMEGKFQVWVDIDNAEKTLVPGFKGQMSVELTPSE